MKIKYPSGQKPEITNIQNSSRINKNNEIYISNANRGMSFEYDINQTNDYYRENNLAIIYKRATPVKVIKFNSKTSHIVDGVFERISTTDYNGIYKGYYLDFEAKSTLLTSSFPLSNILDQQLEHLKSVIFHGGIAFFLIQFERLNEVYLLRAKDVLDFIEKNERKSLPLSFIRKNGFLVPIKYFPRIDYLSILDTYIL